MTPYHWLAQPVNRPCLYNTENSFYNKIKNVISVKPYNSKVIPTVVDQTY